MNWAKKQKLNSSSSLDQKGRGQNYFIKLSFYMFLEIKVCKWGATMIEKFFLDSDDGLCTPKNRQIQWN